MKSFNQLTTQGKARRLRKVALEALTNYDLQIKAVSFLTIATNTLFKVLAETGEKFALRISTPGEATLADHEVELFWLAALSRDTNLNVARPVPRRDGQLISYVTHPHVPETRRCVLFRWIPGRELEHYLTPKNYFKLGQLMARLHDHAATLMPLPAHLQPKRWDRVFYYEDEPAVYKTAAFSHLFSHGRIELLDHVVNQGNRLLGKLHRDENGRFLIHGDLHFWNVHLYHGQLYALDFEDVMAGYPVQDVAISLGYGRNIDGYTERYAAFEEGYSQLRPWPVQSDAQRETLIAARRAMFINYAAHALSDPADYLTESFVELTIFIEKFGV